MVAGSDLQGAKPQSLHPAAEGEYLELRALAPSNTALLLACAVGGGVGVVIPLDDFFDERLETARRLHALLVRRRPPKPDLSDYRRRRLKMALRALDGSLDGADYRAIAEALFGDRVPKGSEFRVDSLRAQTIRLVRYGTYLMRGGYLELLRPNRRAR